MVRASLKKAGIFTVMALLLLGPSACSLKLKVTASGAPSNTLTTGDSNLLAPGEVIVSESMDWVEDEVVCDTDGLCARAVQI